MSEGARRTSGSRIRGLLDEARRLISDVRSAMGDEVDHLQSLQRRTHLQPAFGHVSG
jgi:hypothetical protein